VSGGGRSSGPAAGCRAAIASSVYSDAFNGSPGAS
jgi:hypothetical protein